MSYEAHPGENGEIILTHPSGGSKGTKPVRLDLIPVGPLAELAEHFGSSGGGKYPDVDGLSNWRLGFPFSLSYAAMGRHYLAALGGEDIDPETGRHHLTAVAWHCLTLLHHMQDPAKVAELDDRQAVLEARRSAPEGGMTSDMTSGADSPDENPYAGTPYEVEGAILGIGGTNRLRVRIGDDIVDAEGDRTYVGLKDDPAAGHCTYTLRPFPGITREEYHLLPPGSGVSTALGNRYVKSAEGDLCGKHTHFAPTDEELSHISRVFPGKTGAQDAWGEGVQA